jgi:VanZ family protein
MFIADIDETIQTYVIDRSGSIRDVWIDFAGGCTGILAGLGVIVLLTGFWILLGFGRKK